MKKALYVTTLAIGALVGASILTAIAQTGGTCVTPGAGWQDPSSPPPGGNVCPPINTGTADQGRIGGLAIGSSTPSGAAGLPTSGYKLDVNGKGLFADLGITNSLTVGGIAQFGGNIRIATGTPAAGEVLTAVDSAGTATWLAPSATGGACTSFGSLPANTDWTAVNVPSSCSGKVCGIAVVADSAGVTTDIGYQSIIQVAPTASGIIWTKVGDNQGSNFNGNGNEDKILDILGGSITLSDDKPSINETSQTKWSYKNSTNKNVNFYVCN